MYKTNPKEIEKTMDRIIRKTSVLAYALFTVSCTLSSNSALNKGAMKTDVNKTNIKQSTNVQFTGKLPVSPRIIKGTFDNGIRYIIRKNVKPENRAELRLVINAGSILEDDNQQGFAHLAEHMAFNGTEDFKKQEIIDYIESIGMKFGAHLNAHTSFDETVYKLQLPTDDKKTLETGVHILENWAHKISFEPVEIDKERGVVIEEWRRRQGAQNRIQAKRNPIIFNNSKYADRLPIGKKDILKKGSHENLIRFYKDWYRPELMSIIAVGDFEPNEVKALFEKYFSTIPTLGNKKTRTVYTLPDNSQPLISIETDPEITRTSAAIMVKQPLFEVITYEQYRQSLIHGLYTGMLNNRLRELTRKGSLPVVGAGSRFGDFVGEKSIYSLGATIKSGETGAAIQALLREVNRTIENGFTPTELARQKNNVLRRKEKTSVEADNKPSRAYATSYVRHMMRDKHLLSPEREYEISQQFLPQISLQEVNVLGAKWLTKKNSIITITAPEKEKNLLPTEMELTALWDEVAKEKLAAYQEAKVPTTLMTKIPEAGTVIRKNYDKSTDSHTWLLSNGAKVILKKTDFKNDEILFSGISDGGTSLLDDETFYKTLLATRLVSAMGIGDYDATTLAKFKQGKNYQLSAYISSLHERLKGGLSPKDLSHFMQTLHLTFTSPRKDQQAFSTYISRMEPLVENKLNSPNGVFSEEIRKALYGDNPRSFSFNRETLHKIDLDSALDFYQQRFKNAGDFTFAFVGNIDFAEIEQMIVTYIASLPSDNSRETWQVAEDKRSEGAIAVNVLKGVEPKAEVRMQMHGSANWSQQEKMQFDTLKSTLNTVLRERIREEKSGVYSIRVAGKLSREPREYFNLSISFNCDPVRVDELVAEVKAVLEEFKSTLVDKKYLDNFKKQAHKRREVAIKTNKFWLYYLVSLASKEQAELTLNEYKDLVDSMTVESLKASANEYLDSPNHLLATLLPEKSQ